ncbi:MAG: V-type ATP synthase subunit F [Anaerolineae bacterium]|jgi:V/A-type H+-transporting ATPase subunit F|nr:V-type ATP synthase subunit F [Anaerolineae bacterium]
MKIHVVGHSEAVQGFALVGIQGQIAQTAEEVNAALDHALEIEDLGIIFVTEDAAALVKTRINQLKYESEIPLVVEIPSPDPSVEKRDSLNEIIERAIGIKF